MCNFSQGVWEKGMEAGRKEGMEAGRKEGVEAGRKEGMEAGRKEGAAQNMLNSIKNLLKNTGWPIEQVMSMLGVPDADRPKYLEALKDHALSAPVQFCNFSPNRECKKVAGKGVQPLNNYTCPNEMALPA